ncbi:hypothetical protein L2E82_45763 [Cichorium intybus]|uniref:Uncharacterized protein n=1 Tax=Cichorium intybus TaxID=13427 RepID=A0ACB8ZV81_CICIN|nr:hypothetical protein L2E82_45763 [Cichorium intybus]
MSLQEGESTLLTVDVHYNGTFGPKPLVYFDPDRASVRDIDFSGMGYSEFIIFLEKLTRKQCKNVYFCLPQERLAEGIHILHNDGDYKEFLEMGYNNGKRISVYVDHYNEPIFDWIEDELQEDETNEDGNQDCEEDVDSVISDTISVDHEEDGDVVSTNKTKGDKFLNILCPIESNTDDIEEQNEDEGDKPQYPVHDETQQWDKMKPMLGMRFSDPNELKHMLSNYAVANGYDLWFDKNDSNRLLVKCCKKNKEPSCPFRLWASWMGKERSFQIKSLNDDHNCSRAFKLGPIVTYKWIGKHFMSDIIERPNISLRKMKAQVSKKFNINVSVGQCRNAKRFALKEIEGSLIEHYGKLWSYGQEVLRANPGSTVKLSVDIMPDSSTTMFSKFYVCLKAIRDGWIEGCRRVIGVDGCFLKGIVRGEILSAIGRDANNHIYPIAWAVVCVENKETWKWFLDLLMDDINGGLGAGITILSDGHKGLLEAVKERCPEAEHRQCARHIIANFRKRFTGEHFRKLFWRAVKASTEDSFKVVMEEIKSIDVHAYEYLKDRDPRTWSKAFFQEGRDCDAVENGVSESFNSAVRSARRKPIITMLEEIRIFVMERIYNQRLRGMEWDLNICPAIRKKIQNLKVSHRFWGVSPCGYQKYEVRLIDAVFGVDLIARKCACRIWQLSGVPCVHAMAAIAYLNQDPETFVSPMFSKEAFLKCYKYSINPLNGSNMWPSVDYMKPLPPKKRRLPGRPTVKRKRDAGERELSGKNRHTVGRKGSLIRCSVCKVIGHNKTKCPSQQQNKTGSTSGTTEPPPPPQKKQSQQPKDTTSPPPTPVYATPPPPPSATPPPAPLSATPPPPLSASPPPPPPLSATPPPAPLSPTPPPPLSATSPLPRRLPSERITKNALKKNIPGVGSTEENPTMLDKIRHVS